METNLNISLSKNEKILAFMTCAAVVGFAVLFMQVNLRSNSSASQIGTDLQIDYKMARPEEGYSEYSLNGREIDHTYEAVQRKQGLTDAENAAEMQKALAAKVKPEVLQKAEAAKKKVEAAQKAAVAARAQAVKNSEQTRQKALDQQPTNESSSDTAKSAKPSDTTPEENQVASGNDQNRPNNPDAPIEDPNAKKKDKKTFAQWREQIFAQPTRESVNAFLEAYRKGDISATEVQAMSQDLLDQNNDTLKGLGLYALRATPSLASLSQLVHAEAQLSATYKTYVEQAYLAYLQPQNVSFLNQALQTKDKTLIARTLAILNTNLPNVGKGNNSASVDSRGRRDSGSLGSNITMSSFSGLLPALTTLAGSQEFAGLAQQVMAYIQSSNTVAQN